MAARPHLRLVGVNKRIHGDLVVDEAVDAVDGRFELDGRVDGSPLRLQGLERGVGAMIRERRNQGMYERAKNKAGWARARCMHSVVPHTRAEEVARAGWAIVAAECEARC